MFKNLLIFSLFFFILNLLNTKELQLKIIEKKELLDATSDYSKIAEKEIFVNLGNNYFYITDDEKVVY